jgi:16S rRNA (adenine1518-N6/adenine1519-N6)-dimethyltransferase
MNHPALLPLSQVIDQHGLRAKKSLGQHFLLDTNLLAKIVRAAGDISGTQVVEVGPGPGGLTRAILAANPPQLIAIEKDARCLAALAPLKEIYGEKFTLIEADAMQVDIATLCPAPRAVIANLPYNVGTALMVDWMKAAAREGQAALTSFTVMLQKEVAERMVASVGDKEYGRLAVLTQQYCDATIMFEVPAGAFSPPPKVTSAVLHARIRETPREDVPLAALEKVTAAAFGNRRKMLRQSLKSLGVDAITLCAKAGIEETLRAEQCSLAMFARLARALEASIVRA